VLPNQPKKKRVSNPTLFSLNVGGRPAWVRGLPTLPWVGCCHDRARFPCTVFSRERVQTNDEGGGKRSIKRGLQHAGRPTQHLQRPADAKYRKHIRPCKALSIACLPVIANTVVRLLEDAVRLLYHGATVKASGNVDNEGRIGRECEGIIASASVVRISFARSQIMFSAILADEIEP